MKTNHQLRHLGAENCVTGSCHLLQFNNLNIMVDCGLAQGRDSALSIDAWPLPPSKIDYLFLTHAHIDHTGRGPELIQKGFDGEIICTHPTKSLLSPMLADAMRFNGMPAGTDGSTFKAIDDRSWGFEYGEQFDLENAIVFMLRRAGHILGSCFVRIEDERNGWSALVSGDLGAADTPLLHDSEPADTADLVVRNPFTAIGAAKTESSAFCS